jgi:hypothetical protein
VTAERYAKPLALMLALSSGGASVFVPSRAGADDGFSLERAAPPDRPPPPRDPATTPPARASAAPTGIVLLALDGATDRAWPLAQSVYGDAALRPATLDETGARALAGEPAKEGWSARARELSELRAAVHGEDAASRRILASLCRELSVRGIVVVSADGERSKATLFVADGERFEPAAISPASGTSPAELVASLRARFAPEPPRAVDPRPEKKSVFRSGWFWGAVALAAGAASVILLTGRETEKSSTIQLNGRVGP